MGSTETMVVLKRGKKSRKVLLHILFHRNNGCIETLNRFLIQQMEKEFHRNNGCIETLWETSFIPIWSVFHRNNGCIETQASAVSQLMRQGSTETMVVLKPIKHFPVNVFISLFHRNNGCIETKTLQIRPYPLRRFHRNNGCIETLKHQQEIEYQY